MRPNSINYIILLWLAALPLLIGACSVDSSVALRSYNHIEGSEWNSVDKQSFVLDTVSTTGDYRLSVGLRATKEVQLREIYIVVEQQLHNPALYQKDTLKVLLTDEQGNMMGKGLALHEYVTPLSRPVHLHKGQSGEITLGHIMRRTQLKGITDVGIKIEYEDSRH